MKEDIAIIFVCLVCLALAQETKEKLPPILGIPDGNGHMQPDVGSKPQGGAPLLGRPDGHEERKEPLMGRPDGHEENKEPLMGRPDGHEERKEPLMGRPDGHEERKEPLMGRPDGHEGNRQARSGSPEQVVDQPDSSEEYGHEIGGQSEDGREYFEDWNKESVYEDDYDSSYDGEPLIRCKRPTCDVYCPNGFQTDESGCPVCLCLEDACLNMTCEKGFTCVLRDCISDFSCVKLIAECVQYRESSEACAMPMCFDHCEHGYMLDSKGCMTCDCIVVSPKNPEAQDGRKGKNCPEIECLNRCVTGYQTDESGCMLCECKDSSGAASLKKSVCAIPMCSDYCPKGYKNDANGCMTCTCNDASAPESVCAVPMCSTECVRYKKNENGCQTCDCDDTRPVVGCPMYKCVGGCARYKKDANGCQTCECDGTTPVPLCGEKICESGEICQERIVNFRAKMLCIPKPLCFTNRETFGKSRLGSRVSGSGLRDGSSSALECESNGVYKPLQCDALQAECWCVDDRGVEIDETRTSVYIEDHKPRCARNITVALNIRMTFAETERDVAHVEQGQQQASVAQQLMSTLPEQVSNWMIMDKQYISVLTVEDAGLSNRYQANILVRQDGESDLPSALEHMKRKMYLGLGNVLLSTTELIPVPESMVTEYKFSHMPKPAASPRVSLDNGVYEESENLFQYCWRHRSAAILIGGMTAMLLLVVIFITAMVICRRRRFRNRMNVERRQRLASEISASSEKSLLDGRDDKVLLVSAEPIDDRTRLA